MGATPIDNNDADGKSGKLYGWLLIIRCTRIGGVHLAQIVSSESPSALTTFIPASNEPSGHACMHIWRLPRGSNTPLLALNLTHIYTR